MNELELMSDCEQQLMGYSNEKARQVLTLLNNDQLTELKQRVYKGGYTNNKSSARRSGR